MTNELISNVLELLQKNISNANIEGNVDGLLAQHILGHDSRLQILWNVNCSNYWLENTYDPSNLAHVAALGYTIERDCSLQSKSLLEQGFQRATKRDISMTDHSSALYNFAVLFGLTLGAQTFNSIKPEYYIWIQKVIEKIKKNGTQTQLESPLLAYIALKSNINFQYSKNYNIQSPLDHCAALDWILDQDVEKNPFDSVERRSLRAIILEKALAETIEQQSAYQAALLWKSLRSAISEKVGVLLKSSSEISYILTQFESCLRRWRWDDINLEKPVRWPIQSEREVQDILWIILRSRFPDLEDEDTLPKFGHSTYKADLGIPSLKLLIEVKFARKAADFKKIEKEVLEDKEPYLSAPERYREILVFIYDDSCSVQEHSTTQRALKRIQGIADVIIVNRPSQLPICFEQINKSSR